MSQPKSPELFDNYYTETELSAVLNKTVRTLRNWRADRCGPPVTLIGRSVYYSKNGVVRWLEGLERQMVRANSRKRR